MSELRVTRKFSWHMVNETHLGWPFVIEAEIRRMLAFMECPEEIEITLRKNDSPPSEGRSWAWDIRDKAEPKNGP